MLELRTEGAALLVVDMQNGFCKDGGSIAKLDLDWARLAAPIAPCARLVEVARKAGIPVIFTRFVYRADFSDGGEPYGSVVRCLASVRLLASGPMKMPLDWYTRSQALLTFL